MAVRSQLKLRVSVTPGVIPTIVDLAHRRLFHPSFFSLGTLSRRSQNRVRRAACQLNSSNTMGPDLRYLMMKPRGSCGCSEEIDKLRQGGDGHIVVWGAVSFWRSLMRLDLIDELQLSLFPYVVGEGTRLFQRRGPQVLPARPALQHRVQQWDRRAAVPPAPLTQRPTCTTSGNQPSAATRPRVHGPTQTNQGYWRHRRDRPRRVDTEDQPQKPTTSRGIARP